MSTLTHTAAEFDLTQMKTRNQALFTRREFCTLAASSTAVLLAGTSNTLHSKTQGSFDGEVLVVGAGPAGMTAANLLRQAGVNCTVLEASSSVGGLSHTRGETLVTLH